ncbi:MAG: helix-turn-helix domain-containing protein [Candidatus Omnitrophica bacterium]|nr:helix-turn-helix domain-containing protein [Candidatus Omnitrophota bacterium]
MSGQTKVLTTRELADYIKLNEKTILKMAQQGELPGRKIGNQWRFHLEAVDRFLQRDLMRIPEDTLDSIINMTDECIPLSRLFDIALMDLYYKADTKKQVLKGLVDIARRGGVTRSRGRLFKQLLERETLLSTAVGNGIAIPHPRNPDPDMFKTTSIIMARSSEGLEFDAPDGRKVNLFFMICAPDMKVHLRLMAKLSKLLHIEGVFDRFMKASDEEDIIRMLLELEKQSMFRLNPAGEMV